MLVETIYKPTLKDVVSGIRQTRFIGAFATTSAASTSVQSTTSFTVPPDTARFLTGVSASALPGAAQNLLALSLTVSVAGTFTVVVQLMPFFRAANSNLYVYAPLDLLTLPGEVISLIGNFDAGGVANQVNPSWVWGYDLPRANLSA